MAVAAGLLRRPLARRGLAWTRQGFQLDRADYERRSLRQLVSLVSDFQQRGLCDEPSFADVSKIRSLAEISRLPALTRSGAVALYERLAALYSGRGDVYSKGTGGWSGEPVHHFRNRRVDDYDYGMRFEMQRVMGWRPEMACYCLWGDPRELGLNYARGGRFKRGLRMVRRYGCYAPGPRELTEFLDAVRTDPGCAVYGFPNLLLQCVQFMREKRIVLKPGVVAAAWGTAEALHPQLPALFQESFNVPLRDFYGSREMASISAECEHGRRHINSRYIVEAFDEDRQQVLPEGQCGYLLITDLFNNVTPLIRYQIGDLGAVEWCECDCGRRGFYLRELIGRPPDVIELKSGARFTPHFFSTLTLSFPAIHQFQLVRHGLQDFELRYIGHELSPANRERFTALMTSKTEGANCRVVRVAELEKAASGKARWFVDNSQVDQVDSARAITNSAQS
jgi:phenylacetate-CoA ligase